MYTKGFTIIESLVAISILVLAVIGTSGAVQTGISSYIFSKDQITAFYLAQEGVEFVRNARDENGLNGQPWLDGISLYAGDPCYFGKSCLVDLLAESGDRLEECSGGGCPALLQQEDSGLFNYSFGEESIFTRSISLESISATEVAIVVTMTWSKGLIDRQFQVRENILDWQ